MTVSDLLLSCLNDVDVVEVLAPERDYFRILNEYHYDSEYAIDHFGDRLVNTFAIHIIRYTERISGIVNETQTIRIYVTEDSKNG